MRVPVVRQSCHGKPQQYGHRPQDGPHRPPARHTPLWATLWNNLAGRNIAVDLRKRALAPESTAPVTMTVPLNRKEPTPRGQGAGRQLMDQYKPGGIERGPLGRLIDVIADAAAAGWGQTTRIALLLIVGSAAVALIVIAVGAGHL